MTKYTTAIATAISNRKVYVITHPVSPFWRMISVALKKTAMMKKEYIMCLREGLRNNIVSTVKQSVAINRLGAANMKPRDCLMPSMKKMG
ncbi:hypothetical protein Tco_0993500, partial [Tanacetum coccineum]